MAFFRLKSIKLNQKRSYRRFLFVFFCYGDLIKCLIKSRFEKNLSFEDVIQFEELDSGGRGVNVDGHISPLSRARISPLLM